MISRLVKFSHDFGLKSFKPFLLKSLKTVSANINKGFLKYMKNTL